MKIVSNESSQPLYAQIKETLKQSILDGEYAVNQRLPSESNMMKTFGVSRITVRQALRDLHSEGLVFSVQGKGTFVSRPKAIQDIQNLQGFSEAMNPQGYETSTRVISAKDVRAPGDVADALNISRDTNVLKLTRIRYLNREPVSLDISYFPWDIANKLLERDLAQDIYPMLENELGIALGHAELKIEAVAAKPATARYIDIKVGSPILLIQRLTFSKDAIPVGFEHLFYKGEAFKYQVRITRT